MAKMMDPDESNRYGVGVAKKLGADEAILMTVISSERMASFANSSVTVTKNVKESGQMVYLAKGGRRIIGSSSNPERASLERFIGLLYKSMMSLPKDASYVPLPPRGRAYRPKASHDKKLEGPEGLVAGYVEEAIGAAESAGAKRTAGSLEAGVTSHHIMSSTGTLGRDTTASVLLNIRAFTDRDASGHGLSCAAAVRDFRPAMAGERAGAQSKRMRNARQLAGEGKSYEVLMSPTVASNLFGLVGEFASAFSIEAGTSYLVDKLGKKVASEAFELTDVGRGEAACRRAPSTTRGRPRSRQRWSSAES